MLQKIRSAFFIIYTITAISLFFFIYLTLNVDKVDIKELNNNESEKSIENKIVTVYLDILGKEYEHKLDEYSTVMVLLDEARKKGYLTYEKTDYLDKIVIDEVNGIKSSNNEWIIYENGKKITSNYKETIIVGGSKYSIRNVATQ